MKIVTKNKPYFKIVPRFISSLAMVEFENKMIVPFEIIVQNNKMMVKFLNTDSFVEGANYSFTLKSPRGIIYKGKLMFVSDTTDLQNYSVQNTETKRWT